MNNFYDDSLFWWYDESIRWFLIYYYWPYFILGNGDELMKMGITLNGIRPLCSK
jgi:hypothetical protein